MSHLACQVKCHMCLPATAVSSICSPLFQHAAQQQHHTNCISRSCSELVVLSQCRYCGLFFFFLHATITVSHSGEPKACFRGALSYFWKKQIVLSRKAKWHNWGGDFLEPQNFEKYLYLVLHSHGTLHICTSHLSDNVTLESKHNKILLSMLKSMRRSPSFLCGTYSPWWQMRV